MPIRILNPVKTISFMLEYYYLKVLLSQTELFKWFDLLEAGCAGGGVHGRYHLIRCGGQVGAQRLAATLQHGVVVRAQDGLNTRRTLVKELARWTFLKMMRGVYNLTQVAISLNIFS